jgi:hypothetical protein
LLYPLRFAFPVKASSQPHHVLTIDVVLLVLQTLRHLLDRG